MWRRRWKDKSAVKKTDIFLTALFLSKLPQFPYNNAVFFQPISPNEGVYYDE
jgi:hypothetical protein